MRDLNSCLAAFHRHELPLDQLLRTVDQMVLAEGGDGTRLLTTIRAQTWGSRLDDGVRLAVEQRVIAAEAAAREGRAAQGSDHQPDGDRTEVLSAGRRLPGVGDVIRERFELVEELGAGGMGKVFKALDRVRAEALDREPYVAIKILSEAFQQHADAAVALQREAKKTLRLSHPNVVNVYDFDRDGPLMYMTMEYLSGRSLDRMIKEPGFAGLPIEEVLTILKPLAGALSHAHQQGLVHSDFKPSNVFVTDDGKSKIIDFGIARAVRSAGGEGDQTLFDPARLGAMTPPYASIEQIDGCDPDPRDDIYALACVTYELLTGRHPFNRVPARRALAERMEPVRPPNLNRRQWEGLKRALAFHRDERMPSADALVAALEPRRRRQTWPAARAVAAAVASLTSATRAAAAAVRSAVQVLARLLRKAMQAGARAARTAAQVLTSSLRNAMGRAAAAPAGAKAAFASLNPRQARRALIALCAAVSLICLAAIAWWAFDPSAPPPPREKTESAGPVFAPPPPQAAPEPASPPPDTPPPQAAPEPASPPPDTPPPRPAPEPVSPPPEAAPPLPAPEPAAPPPEASALWPQVASVPCAVLTAEVDGSVVTLRGHAGAAAPVDALVATLRAGPGVSDVVKEVSPLDEALCPPVEAVRAAVAANQAARTGLSISPAGAAAGGEALPARVGGAARNGYLYVDYFRPDGSVLHVLPRPGVRPPRLKARTELEVVPLPPPVDGGADLLVAVMTSEPLVRAPRPEVEWTHAYLPVLKHMLSDLRARKGRSAAAASLAVVTGRPGVREEGASTAGQPPSPEEPAPSPAPTPLSPPGSPSQPPSQAAGKCGNMLQRLQLGEALSDDDRSFFRRECR